MIIAGGLKAKYDLGEPVLRAETVYLGDKFVVSCFIVVKDQSAPQCFSQGGSEKGMVPVLGDINPDNQSIRGAANRLSKLTKMFIPANVFSHLINLLLA